MGSLVSELVSLSFTRSVNSKSRAALSYVPTSTVKGSGLLVGRRNVLTNVRITGRMFHHFSPAVGIRIFVRSKARIGPNSITVIIRNGIRSLLRARHLVLGVVRHVDNVTAVAGGCIGGLRNAGAHMLSAHGAAPNVHVVRGVTMGVKKKYGRHVNLFSVVLLGSGRMSFTNNVRGTISHTGRCYGTGNGGLGVRLRIHGFSRLGRTLTRNISHVVFSGFAPRSAHGTMRVMKNHYRARSSNNVACSAVLPCTRTKISFVSFNTLARSMGKLSVDFGTYWKGIL